MQTRFNVVNQPDSMKIEPSTNVNNIISSPEEIRLFSLNHLKLMHEKCKNCNLHKNRIQTVFSSGPITSKVILFGEALGKNENKKTNIKKSPFIGAAGNFLNKILNEIGLNRDDIYVSNVVKDWPIDNAIPNTDQINACKMFWQEEIKLIKPKAIFTLGVTALFALSEGRHKSVSKSRNMNLKYDNIPLIVLNHPAGVLRNREELEKLFVIGLLKIKDYI